MRLRTGIAALVTGSAVLLTAGALPAAAAQENPQCKPKNGHLYCGNRAPTPIYQAASYGSEDSRGVFHPTPKVDTLKSNPSYFECWVNGEQHAGKNNIWYRTYGDVTHRTGYVPAVQVFTPNRIGNMPGDPFPGVAHCR